jgi:hypothetical protein
MNETRYRLEPLVRLSDRARQAARRRAAAANRKVVVVQARLREAEARCTATVAGAREASRGVERDAPCVRAIAESRVEALFAMAAATERQAKRARESLDEAAATRRIRLDEARVAERDAELQQSTRERTLARIREHARQCAERRETQRLIETWISTRRQFDPEDGNAC